MTLKKVLKRVAQEPALVGGFVTTILPALVVLGVVTLNEQQIAAVLVIVNAIVALSVRLLVTPAGPAQPVPAEA
jgi:hypothetical protein